MNRPAKNSNAPFFGTIKRIGSWRRANCSTHFARFPHFFAWPFAGPLESNEGIGGSSRKGILRTLRRSKNHPTKIKRSRTRLQLVLRENSYWTRCFVLERHRSPC